MKKASSLHHKQVTHHDTAFVSQLWLVSCWKWPLRMQLEAPLLQLLGIIRPPFRSAKVQRPIHTPKSAKARWWPIPRAQAGFFIEKTAVISVPGEHRHVRERAEGEAQDGRRLRRKHRRQCRAPEGRNCILKGPLYNYQDFGPILPIQLFSPILREFNCKNRPKNNCNPNHVYGPETLSHSLYLDPNSM